MSQTAQTAVAVIGIDIDIGKNSFHIIGHDDPERNSDSMENFPIAIADEVEQHTRSQQRSTVV